MCIGIAILAATFIEIYHHDVGWKLREAGRKFQAKIIP
jgi:hypothetical protein